MSVSDTDYETEVDRSWQVIISHVLLGELMSKIGYKRDRLNENY